MSGQYHTVITPCTEVLQGSATHSQFWLCTQMGAFRQAAEAHASPGGKIHREMCVGGTAALSPPRLTDTSLSAPSLHGVQWPDTKH